MTRANTTGAGRSISMLEALGPTGTRLSYRGVFQYQHWLAKLLEPIISRSARQKLDEDLARLKQLAQAE